MITAHIYDIASGKYLSRDTGLIEHVLKDLESHQGYTTKSPPDSTGRWAWNGSDWEHLVTTIPIKDSQTQVWEQIKQRRYEAITSGVYVSAIDKNFHTDETSVTTYSTIGGMIALNNYEPVMWKVMDNSWVLLTVDLFKDLQTAMSIKTNTNYAIAEQHKAAMLQADDPLAYDYSGNWV